MQDNIKVKKSLGGFRGLLDSYRNNKNVIAVRAGGIISLLEGATLKVCYVDQPVTGRARRSVPCVQVVTKCSLLSIPLHRQPGRASEQIL